MKPSELRDPVTFAKAVFDVDLWQTQRDILQAIATERRIAVKAAHSTGKTFASAIAAIHFACLHRNSRVITLSPGWLQTRSVVWAEVHSLLARARYRLPSTNVTQTEIRLGPDNLIIGLSSNQPERLQGHHAEHVLLIADEAPGIEPSFWPSIEGILASGDSHLLITGNPVTNSGYFFEAFGRNRSLWKTFSISAFDTPNLAGLTLEQLLALPDETLDENPTPYLVTKRWVKERHSEWFNGSVENSPLWQSRVLGEFPSASSSALIPLQWLEHARRPAQDAPGREIIVGIDPAGPGKDKTAAVAVSGSAIVDSATWTDADARGPVLAFLRKHQDRLRLVRVDSAGLGFYFTEGIRDAGYRTIGVNVASAPADKEKFANAKAEKFWHLRERFQTGEVSGLTDETLAELAAITWLVDVHGRIAIEGKADVKAALGHSPDLAEALMLALGEGAPQPYEYRVAPPDLRQPMGYGHVRKPASDSTTRCAEHPWREFCGPCSVQREDVPTVGRLAAMLRGRGTW